MTPETTEILHAAEQIIAYHDWQVGEESQQAALQVQCCLIRALCTELAASTALLKKIEEAQGFLASAAAG